MPQAARGTVTFTLRADDGPQRQELPIALTVVAPDFTVTPDRTSQMAVPGADTTTVFALDVAFVDGWDQPMTLRVAPSAAPEGGYVGLSVTAQALTWRRRPTRRRSSWTHPVWCTWWWAPLRRQLLMKRQNHRERAFCLCKDENSCILALLTGENLPGSPCG